MPSYIVPPTPLELGFPEKFSNWRTYQPESIEVSLTNNVRFDIQNMSTGGGKSQCYMTSAMLTPGRSAIVTRTKGLEKQNMDNYESMGLVNIHGKDNYKCPSQPGWTCKDGHAGGCLRKGSMECDYTKQFQAALQAKVVQTNYKFWINIHKYGTGLGTFERLILDEGHDAPDEIADAMQVRLSFHEIEEMLGKGFPPGDSPTGDTWKVWAAMIRGVAQSTCLKKMAQIQGNRNAKSTWIRDYHHLKNLVQKLAIICLMRPTDWVWEMFDWGWQFDPIKFGRYAESRLFQKIPRVSIYSATISEHLIPQMGIYRGDYVYKDWPSTFDPRRSPIYWVPTQKVQYGRDNSALITRIDQFINPRAALNGIIHTSSYPYRDEIVRKSYHRMKMVSNWDDEPTAEAVRRYQESGGYLIGPGVSTGYDFVDDQCRWSIFTKVPFQPKSKIVDARQAADKMYTYIRASTKLEQQGGRGTRSEEDWNEGIIFDDNMEWFIRRYRFLFTKSYLARYRPMATLPHPLQVA